MLFSVHFWPIAILFAAISGAFAFWLGSTGKPVSTSRGRYGDEEKSKAISPKSMGTVAAMISFVVALLIERIVFYYGMPQLTGSFFGFFTPIFWAIVPAAIIGSLCSGGSRKAIKRSVLAALLLFAWPTVQWAFFAVGPDNAQHFADLPNVTTAGPKDNIPPTDEQHLVMVSPDMAALKAKTALSSRGNYSTRYAIGNLTLQAINGHRYYAAPLVPTNSNDTWWTPLFGGRAESPGYVLVDAEYKEAQPQLKDGFHISVFEDMPFGMKLERFVYLAGYDKGSLDNPTFEVDDNFQPHWTSTYVTPAFGNITGSKISKVLVVDVANFEPVIHAYNQGDPAIKWVDRVVSSNLVKEYANDWGTYGQPYAKTGGFGAWFELWLGISKQDAMVPADGDNGLMLSYTKDEHNIWVVPMTSKNSTDHGVIGVLVFETDQNKATYYPGLRGFNHGGSVGQTMAGAPQNRMYNYTVENLELYNIYGRLTWVAVYTKPQTLGSTFGAIGFMDASKQEVSDVAYGTDLQSALADYASKLNGTSAGMGASQGNQAIAFEGHIWRIAADGTAWRFQLAGDSKHYFEITSSTFLGAPLLRDGDSVKGTYMDMHQPLSQVHEIELVGNGPGIKAAEQK